MSGDGADLEKGQHHPGLNEEDVARLVAAAQAGSRLGPEDESARILASEVEKIPLLQDGPAAGEELLRKAVPGLVPTFIKQVYGFLVVQLLALAGLVALFRNVEALRAGVSGEIRMQLLILFLILFFVLIHVVGVKIGKLSMPWRIALVVGVDFCMGMCTMLATIDASGQALLYGFVAALVSFGAIIALAHNVKVDVFFSSAVILVGLIVLCVWSFALWMTASTEYFPWYCAAVLLYSWFTLLQLNLLLSYSATFQTFGFSLEVSCFLFVHVSGLFQLTTKCCIYQPF